MNERQSNHDRIEEFLADQSIFGLPENEKDELNRLLSGSAVDVESFDRVAAIASLALNKKSSSLLPDALKRKILDSYPGGSSPLIMNSSHPVMNSSHPALIDHTSADGFDVLPANHGRMNRREMSAWFIAAASVAGLMIDRRSLWSIVRPTPSMAASRDILLQTESDVIQTVCKPTDDPSARGVIGDVVWSNKKQEGFLYVKGLAKNEPYVHQYQIWIFDKKQDERYPIDGGTFDIESKEATVVRMNPRLPVVQPTLFAVTIEKRGGVVVSKRNRLILVSEPISEPV